MRIKIFAVFLLILVSPIAQGEERLWQVVFYAQRGKPLSQEEMQERAEIESDLSRLIEGVRDYLKTHQIKYEFRRGAPITVSTLSGPRLFLTKEELAASVGYILIRKNGEYEIRAGLGTDIDILMDVAEFFGLHEEHASE